MLTQQQLLTSSPQEGSCEEGGQGLGALPGGTSSSSRACGAAGPGAGGLMWQ
jgi:hypothetical protein